MRFNEINKDTVGNLDAGSTLKRVVRIGALLFLAFAALSLGGAAVAWYDTANVLTNTTEAQYEDNKNTYDAFWKKVKETAQVADTFSTRFADTLEKTMQGRYGAEGSQAQWQWLKETNPTLPQDTFLQVMRVIEAGRNDFEKGQRVLFDKQRKLKDHIRSGWGVAVWTRIFDFPRPIYGRYAPPEDMDGDGLLTALDFRVVTSERTAGAFQTGKDEAVEVFAKPAAPMLPMPSPGPK